MNLLDNKASKVLVKVVPILLIIALITQFAMVSASNNTNHSEVNITINETIIINESSLNITIPINETNITQPVNEAEQINETIPENETGIPINDTIHINETAPTNETDITKPIIKNITINLKNRQGLKIGNYKLINKTNNIYDLEISSLAEEITTKKRITIAEVKEVKVIIKGIKNIPDKINPRIDSYSGDKPDNVEITTDVFAIDGLDIDNATITLSKEGDVNTILRCKEFNLESFNCLNWETTDIEFTDLGDSIEFTVNSFSAYAGGEIVITEAMHLDSDYSFISDIYSEASVKDNIWSEPIYENQFVRVTFEQELTAENDITLYVRNNQELNTYIEVYYKDSDEKITEFPIIINEKYYKVYLTEMHGSYDTFDLKIVNNDEEKAYLEFDHIIDPTTDIRPTANTDNEGIGTNPANAYDNDFTTYAEFDLGTSANPGTLDYYTYTNSRKEAISRVNVTFDLVVSGTSNDQWGLQYSDNAGTNWYNLRALATGDQARANLSYVVTEQTAGEDGTWNFSEIQDDLRVRIQTDKQTGADPATFYIYETWVVVNYTADTTPPTITLGNPVNNSWINSTNVTFYFTPADTNSNIANCTLVINGVLNQSNQTAITDGVENNIWTTFAEGTYNWSVNCTDASNNTGASHVKIINVDLTAPNITLNSPADNNVNIDDSMIFNFTATDNMATLLNCSIYLNNTLNQTNSSTSNGTATLFNISGIADGTYSWNISCLDNATNVNWSSTRTFEINRSPFISSVSDTPDPIKGGNVIAIAPSGVADPNSDNLRYYCSENSAPTSSNTNCSQGDTVYTSSYSTMNCTFNVPSDTATHTMYCRVYDGTYYSDIVNATYTTDSTPPTLSSTVTLIPDVDDVTTAVTATLPHTFYDRYNDGLLNITVTGESEMSCRYYTSDTAYNPSTGMACLINGKNATCQPVVDTQGSDAHNFYISCADNLSNGQSTSQNIDITSLVTDWTAPTTSDDSNTNVQVPTYTVAITEADNIDGDPTTYYCTDITGNCTPTTEITVAQVQFTSSNRGRNYLRYYSVDDAGNNQTTANQTININQLVNFSAVTDSATTIKGGTNVTITTNSSDADSQTLKLYVCNSTSVNSSGCINAGAYCSNTTGTANLTCSFTSNQTDTTYTWYAYIYDSLNESANNNYSGTYTTDSTAPAITINSPISATYSQNWVTASITLSESVSWAGYSLNGAANVTMDNTSGAVWNKKIEGLSDGDYNLTFYANDTVNNMQNKTINFTIDTSIPDTLAPVITILEPESGSTHTTSYIYLNITVNENASWAAYSLDNAANVTMTEASPTDWYKNITPITDAVHQIKFYVNDTSNNIGNTSTISFTKDSNPPQYISNNNTPLTPNDNQNVNCYSHWNDTVGLSHAIMEENATGSFVNHTVDLTGTDDWGNYTITAANLTPGTVQCRAYANDTLGNLNLTSAWTFTVNDVTPPTMNISYTPNTEDDLDPDVLINVSANVSDNVAVSVVMLQYKDSSETDWNNYTMSKVSNTYYGNFTPANTDNYTFRVWANDSSNNINTSSSTTVEVKKDTTWTVSPSAFSSVSALLNANATLGTILINVTGEYDLEFDLSYTPGTISVYYNDTEPFNLSSGASKNISITATAPPTESSTTVAIKIDATNASASPAFTYVNGTLISYTDGPYLYVTITSPTSTDTITQGDTINISTQVKNMGSKDATGVWLKWSLPSDWANSTSLNRSIGFLGVGETATHAMTATLSSSATTGAVSLNVSAGSSENENGSASVSVTISSAATATAGEAGAGEAGAGGGGGTGIVGASLTKTITGKELLETEETLEVVRGLGNSFPLKITNIYEEATMYDVSLAVDGYLSQYMEITPETIKRVSPGQSKVFTITITSPTYMKKGTYPLDFTITGRLEGKSEIIQSDNTTITILTKKDFVEKRFVTLFIREVSKEEATTNLDEALKDLDYMKEADFPVTKVEKLLEEANKSLEEGNYKKVKEITEEISLIRRNAFEADRLINEVKGQIKLSEEKGINVDEAKNMLNLAIAAFEREDFETAIKRAKDAQLTQLLLSKGKFNILKFLQQYWLAVLISVLLLSVSGAIAKRKLTLVLIERKIGDLDKEEVTINELMRELQEKTFKKKEISTAEYHKQMYNYEKRLTEINQSRARLRSKRARIIKLANEIERLKKEEEEVIEKLKLVQDAYYNKQTITKKQYERKKEEYKLRRVEIEKSIAVLETKLAKKEKLEELKEKDMTYEKKSKGVAKGLHKLAKGKPLPKPKVHKKIITKEEKPKKEIKFKLFKGKKKPEPIRREPIKEKPIVYDSVLQRLSSRKGKTNLEERRKPLDTKKFAKAKNKKAILNSLKDEFKVDNVEEPKKAKPEIIFKAEPLKEYTPNEDDAAALEKYGFKVSKPILTNKQEVFKQETSPIMEDVESKPEIRTNKTIPKPNIYSRQSIMNNLKEVYKR